MQEQGCSTRPTGEDGRVLDRLAGLEKVIPPSLIRQVLQATGRVNGRACKLTHEVMMWVVLKGGTTNRFSQSCDVYGGGYVPNYNG